MKTAHDLFYAEGFHMVGLDRIVADVGVTKTTFYNHFESKDDLVLATLTWHDEWWRRFFLTALQARGGDTPRGQLEAVFDVLEEALLEGSYNGCIFINVAVQFPARHDPAHMAAAEHKRAMEGIIRQLAGYAGADDAEAFARSFALLMEGAYVTMQVLGEREAIAAAKHAAQLLIEAHLPGGQS